MEYYVKLFELFVKATGRKLNKDNYKKLYTKLRPEFIDWLEEYKYSTSEYRRYLESYFGIDLESFYLAELGKGNIDSIVREDACMITPYGYTFSDTYHKNSSLIINENDLIVDYGDFKESGNGISTYITQNPYLNTYVISELKKIHEIHNKTIVLGMYGKIYDQDIKNKIRILKQFRKSVDTENNGYDYEFNTKGDNYFGVVTKK